MANDGAIRTCMVWLAVVILVIGIWTCSWKKTIATYLVGMFIIAALLLPDWDFFDRDFSRFSYPITSQERAAILAQRSASNRENGNANFRLRLKITMLFAGPAEVITALFCKSNSIYISKALVLIYGNFVSADDVAQDPS
ncbi:hypothetical protein ACFE04_025568 [Oxalis oulophora]